MKRILCGVLMLILTIGLTLTMTGCQAAKDVKLAEAFLDDYFEELDNENYDDVLDRMDDDLIDELGGDQTTEQTLILRRKLGGAIDDYTVREVSFDHQGGMTQVTFELSTSYDRQADLDEAFTVLVHGDDVSLIGIELEAINVFDELFKDFVKAYQAKDVDAVHSLFSPIYFDYGTKDDLTNMLTFCYDTAGAFTKEEIFDHTIIMQELDGQALILAEVQARMTHENMDMILRLQVCEQDGEIGFSFIELLPAPCMDISNAYYDAVNQQNINDVMALYREEIFENVEGGAAAWQEFLLATYQNVGAYQGHEVLQWYMDTAMMESGLEEEVIIVVNRTSYEHQDVEEMLGISLGGNHEILYHSFVPLD